MGHGVISRNLWRLSSLLTFVFGFLIFLPNLVSAEAVNINWSWANARPMVSSQNSVLTMPTGLCPNSYQTKEVSGYAGLQKICMTSGDIVKAGTYYADYAYRLAVGFKFDTKMYEVNGICNQYDNCTYIPSSDTLITKQYLTNNIVRSLVIYRNFTNRLKPVITTGVISTMEYNFDSSNPDYTFRNASGYAWPIGGISVSDNGDWLAVEFRQRGIGLLNMKTLEMKRISTLSFNYNSGMDPTSEFAVSNDGNSVAVSGLNVGLAVFGVSPSCGDIATDNNMSNISPITIPCGRSLIDTTQFISRFKYAIQPKFDFGGGELSFYAVSYESLVRQVSLRVVGYIPQRLDYLALGDSFTSGEGDGDSYYFNGTNDEYEKCHLSERSYPFLISNFSNINPNLMKSVACSGATMDDVVGAEAYYFGQGDRFKKSETNYVDMLLTKDISLNSFIPGRVHQNLFVKAYHPKVITIGVGGNDAGFMSKLKDCISYGSCSWANTADGRSKTATEIKNLFGKLVETYNDIHTKSPDSKVYAIGYPKVIDENRECGLSLKYLISDSEKRYINEGTKYLNQVISAAAKSAGIKYLDIYDSLGDHVLCGASSDVAINAITFGDDTNLINDSRNFRFIGNEAFHPNSLGHSYIADAIRKVVGNISNYNYCPNGMVVCPDDTAVVPTPSTYWDFDTTNKIIPRALDYVIDLLDYNKKELVLGEKTLSPGSSVYVEITSTPVSLGNFTSSSDGSLDVSVELPPELEEGYHTIHTYGKTYSGESVEFYQIIEYKKPNVVVVDDVLPVETIADNIKVVESPINLGLVSIETPNLIDKAVDDVLPVEAITDGVKAVELPTDLDLVSIEMPNLISKAAEPTVNEVMADSQSSSFVVGNNSITDLSSSYNSSIVAKPKSLYLADNNVTLSDIKYPIDPTKEPVAAANTDPLVLCMTISTILLVALLWL